MIWDLLNSTLRLCVTFMFVYQLRHGLAHFNLLERWGMGLSGGCSLLTITVIWQHERSPFDGWAGTLFTLGVLVYVLGHMVREGDTMLQNWKARP